MKNFGTIFFPEETTGDFKLTINLNVPLERSLDWLHTLQARFEEIAKDVGCNDCNEQISHVLAIMSQELKAAAGKALEVSEQIDWTLAELGLTVHKKERAPVENQLMTCPTLSWAESSFSPCD